MTLIVSMPGRRYEISDVYVMGLTFVLFFSVTRIVMAVIRQREKRQIKIQNPRGGGTEIQLSDDNELAFTILSCIADNEQHLVKNPEIKKWVFNLVKEKIKNESLVLTPNMMRFLARKLLTPNPTLLVKIGNLALSSTNRTRLLIRLAGTTVIGILGAVFSTLPYAILMLTIYFERTQNCGYNCDSYFQHLPQESPITIYAEESAGHLVITDNTKASQVKIYIPSKIPDQVSCTNDGQKMVTRSYERSRRPAKQVNFSDFRKKDPVLSKFKDLQEPDVPQESCLINDVHDIIDIKGDEFN